MPGLAQRLPPSEAQCRARSLRWPPVWSRRRLSPSTPAYSMSEVAKGSPDLTGPPTQADLLSRQRRVVDMLTSMHAHLRDRATTRAKALTVGILCASVVGTAFAFAGGD